MKPVAPVQTVTTPETSGFNKRNGKQVLRTPRSSCPRCRKECRPDETVCLFCDQVLSQPLRPRLRFGQFSLAFLLASMVLVAVTLGVYRASPDLAVALGMIVIPALGRTAVADYLRRRRGGQYSLGGLGITFLVSLAAMIPVLTLAFAGSLLGWAAGILSSPIWMDFIDSGHYGAAFLPAGVCGLAGACYGLWITRPSE